MEAYHGEKHPKPQGSMTVPMDDARFIELCQIARRFSPQQRDQLAAQLMDDQLTELAAEFDNALRIFDYASLDIDSENGPFSSTKTGD